MELSWPFSWEIWLVILAVVVAVVGLIVCCCCCCKKRSKGRSTSKAPRNNVGYKKIASAPKNPKPNKIKKEKSGGVRQSPRGAPVLDLHGMSRQPALKKVHEFIHKQKQNYKSKQGSQQANIITGRGNHSTNNYPVLKEDTKKYLKNKGFRFFENSKGGQLVVDLESGNSVKSLKNIP